MVSGHHCPRCRPCRGIQGMLLWSDAQPDKWKQNGLKALGDNLESELEWISAVCTHSGKGEWREGHRLFGLLSHSDASLSTDLIHGLPLWGMRKQGGDTHRVLCRTRTQPKVGHILGLHRTIVCSFVWLVEGRSKCSSLQRKFVPCKGWRSRLVFLLSLPSIACQRLSVTLHCLLFLQLGHPCAHPLHTHPDFVALPPVGTFWIIVHNTGKLIETKEMLGLEWPNYSA